MGIRAGGRQATCSATSVGTCISGLRDMYLLRYLLRLTRYCLLVGRLPKVKFASGGHN